MNTSNKKSQSSLQTGFTLVELMIALVIGLILTTGILQIYLSNKEAFRTNDALARIQEDGRMVSDILGRNIRMAGYRWVSTSTSPGVATGPEKKFEQIFPDNIVYMGGSTDGQVIAGSNTSLTIAYQADGNILACTSDGTTVNPGDRVKTELALVSGSLVCRSVVCAPCSLGSAYPSSVTIARNFITTDASNPDRDFKFTYGIDTDASGAANRYANTILATDSVTSVRISYTLESTEKNTGVYNTTTSKRSKLSKTFTTTIALRNIVP